MTTYCPKLAAVVEAVNDTLKAINYSGNTGGILGHVAQCASIVKPAKRQFQWSCWMPSFFFGGFSSA